jgi:CHASE3 domain sensor protein
MLGRDHGPLVGIAVIAALVATTAAVSYQNIRSLDENAHRVAHTQEVLDAISDVRADISAAALQRYYLITGDAGSLPPL